MFTKIQLVEVPHTGSDVEECFQRASPRDLLLLQLFNEKCNQDPDTAPLPEALRLLDYLGMGGTEPDPLFPPLTEEGRILFYENAWYMHWFNRKRVLDMVPLGSRTAERWRIFQRQMALALQYPSEYQLGVVPSVHFLSANTLFYMFGGIPSYGIPLDRRSLESSPLEELMSSWNDTSAIVTRLSTRRKIRETRSESRKGYQTIPVWEAFFYVVNYTKDFENPSAELDDILKSLGIRFTPRIKTLLQFVVTDLECYRKLIKLRVSMSNRYYPTNRASVVPY